MANGGRRMRGIRCHRALLLLWSASAPLSVEQRRGGISISGNDGRTYQLMKAGEGD